MRPRVAIIILNWNGADETLACLASLRQVTYPHFEVLVIDNGSRRSDWEVLQAGVSRPIQLLRNEENRGFAGGMNQGIRHLLMEDFGYFLLLNNDTVVRPDFLDRMIDVTESAPEVGITGPLVYEDALAEKPPLSMGRIKLRTATTPFEFRIPSEPFTQCEMVHGCCFLIRRSLIDKIGLLDEEYFAYYEESDYCVRAKRAGFQAGIVRDAVIYHHGSVSVNRVRGLQEYAMMRNRILFVKKNASASDRLLGILHASLVYGPKRIARGLMLGHPEIVSAIARGWWDGVSRVPFRLPKIEGSE